MIDWYTSVLKRYAEFSGRAARPEYWYFALVNLIIYVVVYIIATVVSSSLTLVADLYALAVLIPSLAVGVRRLHDTNRSGWWLLIGLIPLLGGIVLLVFVCLPGTPGENRYGAAANSVVP